MAIVTREPLNEKQDYDAMLNDVRKLLYGRPFIPEATREIEMEGLERAHRDTVLKYKRNDLAIWLTRVLKVKHIMVRRVFIIGHGFTTRLQSMSYSPEEKAELVRELKLVDFPFVREWLRQNNVQVDEQNAVHLTSMSDIGVVERNLDHFLSLPIPAIQNYRFGWQTEQHVFEEFRRHEEIWKEQNKGVLPFDPQNESTFLKLDGGFEWVLLPREYCSKEGKAMGHCGNAGSPQPGDRILSLRQRMPNGWRVCLTFILDYDAKLGEMKGRGNEKPAQKYHPQIVPLLLDDRIRGIKGGGYLADHNFSLDDLDESTQIKVMNERPELFTIHQIGDATEFDNILVKERILDGMKSEYTDDEYSYKLEMTSDNVRHISMRNIFTQLGYADSAMAGDLGMLNGGGTLDQMLRRLEAFLMLGLSPTSDKEIMQRVWKLMPRNLEELYKTPKNFFTDYKNGNFNDGMEKFFRDIYGPALVLGYWKYLHEAAKDLTEKDIEVYFEKSGTPTLQWSLPIRLNVKYNINSNMASIPHDVLGHLINMGKFKVVAELDKVRTQKALDKASSSEIERFVSNCFQKDKWVSLGHTISMRFKKPLDIKSWDDWSQTHYLDGVDAKFIRQKLEVLPRF